MTCLVKLYTFIPMNMNFLHVFMPVLIRHDITLQLYNGKLLIELSGSLLNDMELIGQSELYWLRLKLRKHMKDAALFD